MKKTRISTLMSKLLTLLFVLGMGVFLVFVIVQPYLDEAELADQRLLDHRYHTDTNNLQTAFDLYVQTLYSARGFIAAGDEITRAEWKTYFKSIGTGRRLPGLGLLAYIEQVPASQKDTFLKQLQNDRILQSIGMNNIVIHPDNSPEVYQVTKYIEPAESTTLKSLLGFDFSSEETRRTALEKARDLNAPTTTAPLRFYSNQQSGFVMMLPLYHLNEPIITPEQRRNAYYGLVVISIRIKDIFDESFAHLAEGQTLVQVYDGVNTDPNNLIYQNMEMSNVPPKDAPSVVDPVIIADRTLTVKYTSLTPPPAFPFIRSLWGRIGLLVVTNVLTATFIWTRVRTSKR